MKSYLYEFFKAVHTFSFFVAAVPFFILYTPAAILLKVAGKLCGHSKDTVREDLERFVRFREAEN